MTIADQALGMARLEAGDGTPEQRTLVLAKDRLDGMLSTLDSKTSALLRFNAIVVAALAYLVVVRSSDPFAGSNAAIKTAGMLIGHVSLLASVVSCGFAFPVINVEPGFLTGRAGRADEGKAAADEAAVQRLGRTVERRTSLYAWAWRLAVAGGTGFALLVGLAVVH